MSILILFLSSYVIVLLLGLQSQFVRDKEKLTSFCLSIGIGTCQVFSYKLVPNADTLESIAFILGGALGIVSSIILHNFYLRKFKK